MVRISTCLAFFQWFVKAYLGSPPGLNSGRIKARVSWMLPLGGVCVIRGILNRRLIPASLYASLLTVRRSHYPVIFLSDVRVIKGIWVVERRPPIR